MIWTENGLLTLPDYSLSYPQSRDAIRLSKKIFVDELRTISAGGHRILPPKAKKMHLQ